MYPMYMGRRVARIRIGNILSEIKSEKVAATLLKDVKFEKQVVHVNKTRVTNETMRKLDYVSNAYGKKSSKN